MLVRRVFFAFFAAAIAIAPQTASAIEKIKEQPSLYISSLPGQLYRYSEKTDSLDLVAELGFEIESIAFCENGILSILSNDKYIYKLRINKKKIEKIGPTTINNIKYIACTQSGQLYGMSANGRLYQISSKTGHAYGEKVIGKPFNRGGPITRRTERSIFILGNYDFKLGTITIPRGKIDSYIDRWGGWQMARPTSIAILGETLYYSSGSASIYTINIRTRYSRSWRAFDEIKKVSGLAVEPSPDSGR